jgi:ATP-dependent Lhr-like helicase
VRSIPGDRARARGGWPEAESAEELHEALCSGWAFVTRAEAAPGRLGSTSSARRARCVERGAVFAVEASRAGKRRVARPLEALRPLAADDPLARRVRPRARSSKPRASCCARASKAAHGWCSRRLLARIHRYTLDRLRQDRAGQRGDFLRFLGRWQHATPERASTVRAA